MPNATRLVGSAGRHLNGLRQLRHQDIWIGSYPRSGNTRLRLLLGQMALLEAGSDERCVPRNVEQLMPVWGFHDLDRFPDSPRFIKTHRVYTTAMGTPDRSIHIVRDPSEAIASFYQMSLSRNRSIGSFSDFLRNPRVGADRWSAMTSSWGAVATVTIHYSDLMADAGAVVIRTLETLGVDADIDRVRLAAKMTDHESIRSAEEEGGIRDGSRFDSSFRAVGAGNDTYARELFSVADRDWLRGRLVTAGLPIDPRWGVWE